MIRGALSGAGLLLAAFVAACSGDTRSSDGSPASAAVDIGALSAAGIPALVFHQICSTVCAPTDTYGITHAELERMMIAVKRAGYESISMPDFVRAHAGDARGLPTRPILITFDDGRLDAYRGADDVLRALALQATMFVITAVADRPTDYAMQWPEIKEAVASGRWTIQLHAHAGHVQVPVSIDATGAQSLGAFYAWRRCDPLVPRCGALESFDDWKQRAERDIETGDALLASQLGPGYSSVSFAVPFNAYGQSPSNDDRIQPELRAFLDARFPVWFTQPTGEPDFMRPSRTDHQVPRYRVLHTTTAEDIEAWLAKHAAQ